jgi:hypothetical protein
LEGAKWVGFTFVRYTFEEKCCNALKEFLKSADNFIKKIGSAELSGTRSGYGFCTSIWRTCFSKIKHHARHFIHYSTLPKLRSHSAG